MNGSKSPFDLQTCARPNILELQPYRCARDDYKDDGTNILLDANENAYGPSLSINGTLLAPKSSNNPSIDFLGLHRYPDPHQHDLKQLLCKLRNTHTHTPKTLTPENLFVGVGSDEAIDALLRCFCVPGRDKILVCPPTYGMYSVSAQVNDVGLVKVPLLPAPEFALDVEAKIYKKVLEHPIWNGIVVMDEAYIDFAPEGSSLAEWVLEWPNLVVMQTLSKAFGLAGIRLGAAFTAPPIASLLNNLKAPYNISSPTSAIATQALLEGGLGVMRTNVGKIVAQRERLLKELPKIKGVGRFRGGTASNFLLVEMLDAQGKPDNVAALKVYERLAENRGVVVSLTTSEGTTTAVYLRWLEIHRKNRSALSEHWSNTLLHWAQSLRSRGYRMQDLITAVSSWEKDHEGKIPDCGSGRHPPTKSDIEKAFADTENVPTSERKTDQDWRRDTSKGDSYRPSSSTRDLFAERPTSYPERPRKYVKPKKEIDDFSQPPPSNYICNRCGKKGHHLQACPTNMDPSYDKPPGNDYVCPVCKRAGKHYKSLCPENKDPLCIIQKRKSQGIITPSVNTSQTTNSWSRWRRDDKDFDRLRKEDRDYGRLGRTPGSSQGSSRESTPTPSKKAEALEKLQELDDMRVTLLREEKADSAKFGVLGTKDFEAKQHKHLKRPLERTRSSSPDEQQAERKKIQKTGANTMPLGARKPREVKDVDMKDIKTQLDELLEAEGMADDSNSAQKGKPMIKHDGNDIVMNIMDTDGDKRSEMSRATSHTDSISWNDDDVADGLEFEPIRMLSDFSSSEDSDSEDQEKMDIDGSAVSAQKEQPAKEYSPFVQLLVEKREEMREVVNIVKGRPTAFDMWKENDKRAKLQRKAKQENRAHNMEPPSPNPPIKEPERQERRSPSQVSEYYESSEFPQLDGACDEPPPRRNISTRYDNAEFPQLDGPGDERPLERNKTIRRKNRFSDLGKEAVGKVKEITSNFGFKSRSKARRQSEQNTSVAESTDWTPTLNTEKEDTCLSEQSINIPRNRDTSSPVKLAQGYLTIITTTKPEVPRLEVPTEEFGSLDVNDPRQRENLKPLCTSSMYSARDSHRDLSLTPSRSTNEFRSTVRRIIEESKAEEFKRFADSFKLSTPMPADIVSMTTRDTTRRRETDHGTTTARPNFPRMSSLQPEIVGRRYRVSGASTRKPIGICRKPLPKKQALEDLKQFSEGFKLSTPVPADIAEIMKIDSPRRCPHTGSENDCQDLKDTSVIFELPEELPEDSSRILAVSPSKE
ncbi:hypothetical protein G7Y89_g14508 [Cudoniella acicularis]|uniref:histidinol-phosphate transaminase n=1 Tax=Cudoniella acicularis TaxID=354080 RepID=A0A8H4VSY7_9HELO|nr:hypothetical protein G7Y89_g14508 [Cudoniella acicularis]